MKSLFAFLFLIGYGSTSCTVYSKHNAQPAIACSKLTIETLEQGVKYVQS